MNSRIPLASLIFALLTAWLAIPAWAAQPLVELRNCKFLPTAWADGDSFRIETADGTQHTVRLYGVDCIEWHVTDKTDATRLAEQRRYFGISEFGGSARSSMEAAKAIGKKAAEETARQLLAAPFTIHTAYADARGDGKNKRIYAFVTLARGEDLAEHLVRAGLARAFGVYRETPAALTAREYENHLRDVELVAAKAGRGAWAATNWDRLPGERREQRMNEALLKLAVEKVKVPANFKINPNSAARDELMNLAGIGEVMANRIIAGRPYKTPDDLLNVEGIGPKTLERIRIHLEF
jgi:competence protein ComEA